MRISASTTRSCRFNGVLGAWIFYMAGGPASACMQLPHQDATQSGGPNGQICTRHGCLVTYDRCGLLPCNHHDQPPVRVAPSSSSYLVAPVIWLCLLSFVVSLTRPASWQAAAAREVSLALVPRLLIFRSEWSRSSLSPVRENFHSCPDLSELYVILIRGCHLVESLTVFPLDLPLRKKAGRQLE